ncbi:MAG: hypothetical protein JWL77_390 [Chthonomonadaceae bacterium]|nr:hypothetical protein [Chthonomonadaceae bacterium]
MYVKKLVIHDFRCFSQTEIELNYPRRGATQKRSVPTRLANVNLFLGGNGSGKSSVLKALVLGVLSPVINSSGFKAEYLVRRKPDQAPPIAVQGGKLLQENAEVRAYLKLDKQDVDSPETGDSIIGQTVIQRTGDFESIVSAAQNSPDAWKNIYLNDSPAFFLVGYGAHRRTERPEGYTQQSRSSRYQRVAGLFEEHVGLVPFNFAHLQLKDWSYLEEAQTILNALLPAEVNLADNLNGQKEPLFNREGVLLPFGALSDGFRAFVGWVWDLLFQMASLLQPTGSAADLKTMTGVVIVDEIDLFLHPEWQRTVIEQVAQMFPRIQFLFSSHSPLVAGTLEPENIFVLESDKVEQYRENIYGLTPNQVLTSSYFGLHSLRAPQSGTLSDLAKATLRSAKSVSITEEAEPNDRGLDSKERALRIMEEMGSE